jgi:hypothetical protein
LTHHHPVGFIEDIPVKVEGIYIPTDFIVVDVDEDAQVPILLGRPFLATTGAIIDVKGGRIVFQVSDEMVGFEIEDLNKDPIGYCWVFVLATLLLKQISLLCKLEPMFQHVFRHLCKMLDTMFQHPGTVQCA